MFCVEINPSEVFFRTRHAVERITNDKVTNESGRVFIQQNMPRIKFIEDLGDIQLSIARYYRVKQSISIEEMVQSTSSDTFYSAYTDTEQSQYKSSVEESLTSTKSQRAESLSTTPNMKHIVPMLERILIQGEIEVVSQSGRFFLNFTGIKRKT